MKIDLEKVGIIASYFSENIPDLYVTKLLKLFYYLDFISYKMRGSSVTNDTYYKFPYGPVPMTIKNEIDMLIAKDLFGPDFKSQLTGSVKLKSSADTNGRIVLNENKKYNLTKIAESELKLMACLVETYKNTSTKNISEQTHRETPWLSTSDYSEISYELADSLDISKILPNLANK